MLRFVKRGEQPRDQVVELDFRPHTIHPDRQVVVAHTADDAYDICSVGATGIQLYVLPSDCPVQVDADGTAVLRGPYSRG